MLLDCSDYSLALKMEAVSSSGTSRSNIPEAGTHTCSRSPPSSQAVERDRYEIFKGSGSLVEIRCLP
jgi:hypothetical protein